MCALQESYFCNGGTMKGNNINPSDSNGGKTSKKSDPTKSKIVSSLTNDTAINSVAPINNNSVNTNNVNKSLNIGPTNTASCSSAETTDSGVRTGDSNQSIAARKLNKTTLSKSRDEGDTSDFSDTPLNNMRIKVGGLTRLTY